MVREAVSLVFPDILVEAVEGSPDSFEISLVTEDDFGNTKTSLVWSGKQRLQETQDIVAKYPTAVQIIQLLQEELKKFSPSENFA